MHPNHLKRAIQRTQKQLKKQRNKEAHSNELHNKIAAKDEIERLQVKLVRLQDLSNGD